MSHASRSPLSWEAYEIGLFPLLWVERACKTCLMPQGQETCEIGILPSSGSKGLMKLVSCFWVERLVRFVFRASPLGGEAYEICLKSLSRKANGTCLMY